MTGKYREHNARSRTQAAFGFVAGLILGWWVWSTVVSPQAAEEGGSGAGIFWAVGAGVVVAVAVYVLGDRLWRGWLRSWWLWD
jgi:hypothetical protein